MILVLGETRCMLFGEDAAAAVVVVVRSQERTSDFFRDRVPFENPQEC